jgi:hypothetical protein
MFQESRQLKFGSGRHRDPRDLVDGRPVLNVHTLEAAGALTPGVVSRWQWPDLAAVVKAEARHVVVACVGEAQVIRSARVAGTRGGDYAFWVCGCGRRYRHLYLKAGHWACRRCHHLDYASRHEFWSPALRQAMKLRQRLGADPQIGAPLPPRPRRYPQRGLYDKLLARLIAAEAAALAALGAMNVAADERRKGAGHEQRGGIDDPE